MPQPTTLGLHPVIYVPNNIDHYLDHYIFLDPILSNFCWTPISREITYQNVTYFPDTRFVQYAPCMSTKLHKSLLILNVNVNPWPWPEGQNLWPWPCGCQALALSQSPWQCDLGLNAQGHCFHWHYLLDPPVLLVACLCAPQSTRLIHCLRGWSC